MEKHIQHLNFIANEAHEIMLHYRGVDMDTTSRAYMELVSRLRASALSIRQLVQGMEAEPSLEFGTALVIRTSILDFFISLNAFLIRRTAALAGKSKDEIKDELKEYFNSVLADGLVSTGTYFIKGEAASLYTEDELHNALNGFSTRYGNFLEPYQFNKAPLKTRAGISKMPSATQLYLNVAADQNGLKELAKRFETYVLYSKYEHFNILSFDVFRRTMEEQAETVKAAVELLTFHYYKSTEMLNYYFEDDFIHRKHLIAVDYNFREVGGMSQEEIEEWLEKVRNG